MGMLEWLNALDTRAVTRRVAAPTHGPNRRRWRQLTPQRRRDLRLAVAQYEQPEDPDDLLMVTDMTITTIRRLVVGPIAERWPGRAQSERLWLEDLLVHAHNLVGAVFATWLAAGDPDDEAVRSADAVVAMMDAVDTAATIRLTRLRHDVGRLPVVSLALAVVFAVTMGSSFAVEGRGGEVLLIVSYVALGSALIPNVLYRRRRRQPLPPSTSR